MTIIKLKARKYGKGRKIFEIPAHCRDDFKEGKTYKFRQEKEEVKDE